jgi:hypothetical protein
VKIGIPLLICLFTMTSLAHRTYAAEASHEEGSARKKRVRTPNFEGLTAKEIERKQAKAGYKAAWYAANKETIAAKRAVNKEEIAASQAAWYAANKEEIEAKRAANKEKKAASQAAWYAANKEKIAVKNKAYRERKKQEKLELLASADAKALTSLQVRIDSAQDEPGAESNAFLIAYNDAVRAEALNPATPRALDAAGILCGLITRLQGEHTVEEGDESASEGGAANFTPRTPYQALEDLLSDSEEA